MNAFLAAGLMRFRTAARILNLLIPAGSLRLQVLQRNQFQGIRLSDPGDLQQLEAPGPTPDDADTAGAASENLAQNF
jgi:hypothetical protein